MKDPRRPISLSSYESQSYYLWLQLLIEGFNIKYMSTLVSVLTHFKWKEKVLLPWWFLHAVLFCENILVPAKLKYFSEQNLEDVL